MLITRVSFYHPLVNNRNYFILKEASRDIQEVAQTLEFIQMFKITDSTC